MCLLVRRMHSYHPIRRFVQYIVTQVRDNFDSDFDLLLVIGGSQAMEGFIDTKL